MKANALCQPWAIYIALYRMIKFSNIGIRSFKLIETGPTGDGVNRVLAFGGKPPEILSLLRHS